MLDSWNSRPGIVDAFYEGFEEGAHFDPSETEVVIEDSWKRSRAKAFLEGRDGFATTDG